MQMLNPQNLAFQQHQQLLRQRQMSAPRGSVVMMDKDQPMVDVKVENVMESQAGSMFNALNKQQLQHLQLRQQMNTSNQHAQQSQQFKQISNVQLPQLQTQYDPDDTCSSYLLNHSSCLDFNLTFRYLSHDAGIHMACEHNQ